MPPEPSAQLVVQLDRLALASPAELRRCAALVGRLAGGAAPLDSLWIDALAQRRAISPWQAAQWHAERADSLRLGDYLLVEPARWPHYGPAYRAIQIAARTAHHLVIVSSTPDDHAPRRDALKALIARSRELPSTAFAPVAAVVEDRDRLAAIAPWTPGPTLRELAARRGRLPTELAAALLTEIAASLAALLRQGIVHGDFSLDAVVLAPAGRPVMRLPGLRAIGRPVEAAADADASPALLDGLSPSRIDAFAPPTIADDLFAFGCAAWELFVGRPRTTLGDRVASLETVLATETTAPDDLARQCAALPEPWRGIVAHCLQGEPHARPRGFDEIVDRLPPVSPGRRRVLIAALQDNTARAPHWSDLPRTVRRVAVRAAMAAFVLALAAGALAWLAPWKWPLPGWMRGTTPRAASRHESRAADIAPAHNQAADVASAEAADRDPTESPDHSDHAGDSDAVPIAKLRRAADPPNAANSPDTEVRKEVRVPPEGLTIADEGQVFKGIDFVWQHGAPPVGRSPAIVRLAAWRATFIDCRFRGPAGGAIDPIAIAWEPRRGAGDEPSLPTGQLQINDSVFTSVRSAVASASSGAAAIRFSNVLHTGPGSLVWLSRPPAADAPVLLRLTHVTVRGGGPLLECVVGEETPGGGTLTVAADDCVFALADRQPLVAWSGTVDPASLFREFVWTGQGSLVRNETPIALWRQPDGEERALDDAASGIAGLIRSPLRFAGEGNEASACRAVEWQAPLSGATIPGIDPQRLP